VGEVARKIAELSPAQWCSVSDWDNDRRGKSSIGQFVRGRGWELWLFK